MQLNEKAMLARLSINQWSGRKQDKNGTKEVAANHSADADQLSLNKYLVPKKSLKEIQNLIGEARREFYHYTLPWKDDGQRILTSTGYFELAKRMRQKKQDLEPAIDAFVQAYPSLVAQAKTLSKNGSLGTLAEDSDFPSEAEIKSKFGFDFSVEPLPVSGDFRVELSDSETKLIKQQIEENNQKAVQAAMQDVWKRMEKVLTNMSEGLKAYKELDQPKVVTVKTRHGKTYQRERYVEGAFHDTLVENIRELLKVIPSLNLEDDQNVTKFAAQMRALTKYDADQLKENQGLRDKVAKAADDILAKMNQFV